MTTSHRNLVSDALKSLSTESDRLPGSPLFRSWFTAKRVAARAGCSVSTARKYLEGLRGYRGYQSHRFSGGTVGYRYDAE